MIKLLRKTVPSAATRRNFYSQHKRFLGNLTLQEHDEEVYELIEKEKRRQFQGLELIASENFTSRAVMECLGSCLTNKYAEGYPGQIYYGGNEVIDKIESLCQTRALQAYRLSDDEWGVNVQPYSGSPANMGVYTALLKPHSRIMGLDLPSGGHLTHGFYTTEKGTGKAKPISATSIYFESLPYQVDETTGIIDYDKLASQALLFKPALIICGGSAYPRDWDYKRFREIADSVGAYLLCDMAHISGLVAADAVSDPFEYADVVSTTTHKSLRGPRSGMIFYKNDERKLGNLINQAIFPGLQGGPHEHQIAGVATQLKEVMKPEFKEYIQQVLKNSKALANFLMAKEYKLATDGTDNHLLLWDLRPNGITGSKLELVCDECHITLNKNSVPGDKSALHPGGVRIGAPAMTTRGLIEKDFEQIGEFLHRALQISLRIQADCGGKTVKKFKTQLYEGQNEDLVQLARDVKHFAETFDMPGI